MKNILTFLLVFFMVQVISAQSFEGTLVYKCSYKSKNPEVTNEQLSALVGSKLQYHIKDGSYTTRTNGTVVKGQLYDKKENKLYTKLSSTEVVYWDDAGKNPDPVLKAEIKKGVTEILGYKCDELTLFCNLGEQKYYYSSRLPVDAELFSKHKYSNMYEYLKRAHSVPLKMILNNKDFTMEAEAEEITPTELKSSLFKLPEGTKTEKNPY